MSFLNHLSAFLNTLNEKSTEFLKKSDELTEAHKLKLFNEAKIFLKESNKERVKLGMNEVSIFEFLKDRPDFLDLLDEERKRK